MKRFLVLFLMVCVSLQAQKTKPVFKRFGGEIMVISEDVIKYDDELLLIYKTDKNLKMVFESGLLFPGMFKFPGIDYQKKDAANPVVHNFTVLSSSWINSKSGQTRFFKFVLLQKDGETATEYFVEIHNPQGTSKSDFRNFVQGAQLKLFTRGKVVALEP